MAISGLNIEEVMALDVLRQWCRHHVPGWYLACLRERFGAGR
jgi:hypothetical protein